VDDLVHGHLADLRALAHHRQRLAGEVHVRPLEPAHLDAPQTAEDEQLQHDIVLAGRGRLEDLAQLLRRERLRLDIWLLRQDQLGAGVRRDDPPPMGMRVRALHLHERQLDGARLVPAEQHVGESFQVFERRQLRADVALLEPLFQHGQIPDRALLGVLPGSTPTLALSISLEQRMHLRLLSSEKPTGQPVQL